MYFLFIFYKKKIYFKTFCEKKKTHKAQILQRFLNHCATFIQKQFRGYFQRKKHSKILNKMGKFQINLFSLISGFFVLTQ